MRISDYTPIDFNLLNRLIKPAQTGDPMAMEQLLAEGYRMAVWLVRVTRYYVPSWEAQDLVQEAAIGFYEAVQTWTPPGGQRFTNFARMCMERNLIEALKKGNRVKHRPLNEAASLDAPGVFDKHGEPGEETRLERWELPDPSGLGADPAELVLECETGELYEDLTKGLSRLERIALDRCMLGRTPYIEAARAFGISPKSIDNALQRVRRKAARLAANDDRFPPSVRAVLRRMGCKVA